MEQINSFDEFYDVKLQPFLTNLVQQNKQQYRWGIISVATAVAMIPLFGYAVANNFAGHLGLILVCMAGMLLISIYNYTQYNDAFEGNFKENIIRQIISFIQPGLTYKPGTYINSAYYKNSCLFRQNYNDYYGDDFIEGTYKDVFFKCSELNVTAGKGSIFRGLFFAAPINNAYSGGTYVWAKGEEQLPASIADEHYRMMPMPNTKRVACHNGVFENHYSVYTTNANEAASLVNEQMMQQIMEFKSQVNKEFVLSFVAGMCYVAIPLQESLLEPDNDKPDDKESIKKYFFTVLLILSIINKLQLYRLQ